MHQMKWFERTFRFDLPVGLFPGVLERLRGTPGRLEESLRGVPASVLLARREGGWSIQEHAGHLGDLEALWDRRLTDLLSRSAVLSEADLTNRATHEANHNESPIRGLLQTFRDRRAAFVARLDLVDEDEAALSAVHPRLRQPMRLIDLALFIAEHDDHHLAVMRGLLRAFAR